MFVFGDAGAITITYEDAQTSPQSCGDGEEEAPGTAAGSVRYTGAKSKERAQD